MPTIRIDDDVYSWLRAQAVPFEDTPNSVLRRIAQLDKPRLEINENTSERKGIGSKTTKKEMPLLLPKDKQITGKYLAQIWNVDVNHALYHKDGTWYNHLQRFPGALFDRDGYVVFSNKREYENCSYLHHGQELNVPRKIRSIPGYKRVQ